MNEWIEFKNIKPKKIGIFWVFFPNFKINIQANFWNGRAWQDGKGNESLEATHYMEMELRKPEPPNE
jgi:hypothetical protein